MIPTCAGSVSTLASHVRCLELKPRQSQGYVLVMSSNKSEMRVQRSPRFGVDSPELRWNRRTIVQTRAMPPHVSVAMVFEIPRYIYICNAENSSRAHDRFRPTWGSSGGPGEAHSVAWKHHKREIQLGSRSQRKLRTGIGSFPQPSQSCFGKQRCTTNLVRSVNKCTGLSPTIMVQLQLCTPENGGWNDGSVVWVAVVPSDDSLVILIGRAITRNS
ncbi:hypothetical protein T265_10084 [Opisthorchis viverrini]|uniref:Uncharacterized protein n=1 Tax=Opisthorchis viverrini TaxID=6198 RepID=A0A074ZEI9_OPIVI|nr:hypothetical protein T265_10084 [Opisthorchis viverrini]KER21640.1 hypothetical protein T265_10084 [Opisthorchis viverrini]